MYYSIFDFQGTVGLCFSIGWLKQTLLRKAHPFGLWSVRDDFSDKKSFPAISRLERQPVYLSIGEICCQAIFLFFSEFFIGCFLSEILQFYFWSLYFVDFKSISYNLFLRESFKLYPIMKYRHFIFSLLHYSCYDSYDFLFCFSGLNLGL